MERTLEISNLKNKSKLHFSSKNNEIDFAQNTLLVSTFFNNEELPQNHFWAELLVLEQNLKNTFCFELPIWDNFEKVKIVLSSNTMDLEKIEVAVIA
ncbi:MAG: hypothetical protein ACK5B9_05800 [Flavobacteriia bacterium]|jgi:hypothetical protein